MSAKSTATSSKKPMGRGPWLFTVAFSIPMILVSGIGFVMKFVEFIHTFQNVDSGEGVFAITPMANYLLASAGFFCLLIWAAVNGMFNDIERPKHTMLEQDAALDA